MNPTSKRTTILLEQSQVELIEKMSVYMDADQGKVIRWSLDTLIDIVRNRSSDDWKDNEELLDSRSKFYLDSISKFIK
jgi:hypothetical protein